MVKRLKAGFFLFLAFLAIINLGLLSFGRIAPSVFWIVLGCVGLSMFVLKRTPDF